MLSDADRIRLAATFDTAAPMYDAVRPGFATAAIDWVLPAGARRVLDLGAGTGKLTAELAARGADRVEVVAVEPAPNMLAVLRERLPDVDARAGSAEELPLGAASVDAVFAGSAFHWFARPRADEEIARVLRPGGRVGLLWNRRDPSFWLSEIFDAALRESREPSPGHNRNVTLAAQLFGPTEHAEFTHSQTLPIDRVPDLLASRSYVIAMAAPDRARLLDGVRAAVAAHAGRSGCTELVIPYRTEALRAERAISS